MSQLREKEARSSTTSSTVTPTTPPQPGSSASIQPSINDHAQSPDQAAEVDYSQLPLCELGPLAFRYLAQVKQSNSFEVNGNLKEEEPGEQKSSASASSSSSSIPPTGVLCSSCQVHKSRSHYSSAQLKKNAAVRRCLECTQMNEVKEGKGEGAAPIPEQKQPEEIEPGGAPVETPIYAQYLHGNFHRPFPVGQHDDHVETTFKDNYSHLSCVVCMKEIREADLCPSCQSVGFCSASHKKQSQKKHEPFCKLFSAARSGSRPEGQSKKSLGRNLQLRCFLAPSDSTACFLLLIFGQIPGSSSSFFFNLCLRHGQGVRNSMYLPLTGKNINQDRVVQPIKELINPYSEHFSGAYHKLLQPISNELATLFFFKVLNEQPEGSNIPVECQPILYLFRTLIGQHQVQQEDCINSLDGYSHWLKSPMYYLLARCLGGWRSHQEFMTLVGSLGLNKDQRRHLHNLLPITTAMDMETDPHTLNCWSVLNQRNEYRWEASVATDFKVIFGEDLDIPATRRLSHSQAVALLAGRSTASSIRRRLAWFAFHQSRWHWMRHEWGLSVLFQLQLEQFDQPGVDLASVPLFRALVLRTLPHLGNDLIPDLPSELTNL